MGGGSLALGSWVTPAAKSKKGCWKEETCRVQLRCLQVEPLSAAGPRLPALLQLCSGRQQLEEKPVRTDAALPHAGVRSPFIFPSMNFQFVFPQDLIIIWLRRISFRKAGLFCVWSLHSLPRHSHRPLYWEQTSIRTFAVYKVFAKRGDMRFSSALLYMFSYHPFHHIFSSNLERCKE